MAVFYITKTTSTSLNFFFFWGVSEHIQIDSFLKKHEEEEEEAEEEEEKDELEEEKKKETNNMTIVMAMILIALVMMMTTWVKVSAYTTYSYRHLW